MYQHSQSIEQDLEQYSPLVHRIAHHLSARLPANVLIDDLLQAGMIGLLEALKNFDQSKGASFETYAGIRIRGSMLDEVRRGDWTPRSVHRNARTIAQTIQTIENETGRDARDSEVAQAMGVELSAYHAMLQDSHSGHILGFEDLGGPDDHITPGVADRETEPERGIERADFGTSLAEAIAGLPEREKLVLALYYDEELNLKEIGQVLGVSESRVSQINSQAMIRLQSRLTDWQE